MDAATGLRALNLHSPLQFRRSTAGIHFSPLFSSFRKSPWLLPPNTQKSKSSPLSLRKSPAYRCCCKVGREGGVDVGAGEVAVGSGRVLNVVLVSPQIAGNTGCIARTCAASAVSLHLVEPLGFKVDDAKLKRAGLDYWPFVVVKIHSSWSEFREYFCQQDGGKRLVAFTKRGAKFHSEFSYKPGDWLIFGSETSGLPPEALLDCNSESLGGGTLRIPMVETYVRCLNLSVSVGIALYEASRQLNYEQIQNPSEVDVDNQRLFVSEDIFA